MRYLEMIQSVISRMASNSFLLKGWSVTLAAGILTLSGKDADKSFYLIAFIPIIIFWLLDTYYLQLERKYRGLFENVRDSEPVRRPFEMNLKVVNYLFKGKKYSYLYCFFSGTQLVFYAPVALVILVVILKLTGNH